MEHREARRSLQEHPFFAGMAPSICELIAGCAANVRFDAGRVPVPRGRAGGPVLPDPARPGRARDPRARAAARSRFQTVDARRGARAGRGSFRPTTGSYDARALDADARDRVRRRVPARQVRRRPRARLRADEALRAERGPSGCSATRLQLLDVYGRPRLKRRWPRSGESALDPMRRGRVAVPRGRQRDRRHLVTLELEPTPSAAAHRSQPGQFNMLYVFGVGEVPISISGDPARPAPLVHTIRAVGAVTSALTALQARRRGRRARPVRHRLAGRGGGRAATSSLVAGGLGLAPLRPAIYQPARRPRRATAASPCSTARAARRTSCSARELEQLARALRPRGRGHGRPRGHRLARPRRRRHRADPRAPTSTRRSTVAMVCGPEVMMRFAAAALLERGRRAGAASICRWSAT